MDSLDYLIYLEICLIPQRFTEFLKSVSSQGETYAGSNI